MFWRILLGTIVFMFLMRFIVNFLLPLFRITIHTSRKIKEVQKKMHQMDKKQQHTSPRPKEGDYIEYEEVN